MTNTPRMHHKQKSIHIVLMIDEFLFTGVWICKLVICGVYAMCPETITEALPCEEAEWERR